MASLTFPLDNFLDQDDYAIAERYLKKYLFKLSSVTPEDILLCIIDKKK